MNKSLPAIYQKVDPLNTLVHDMSPKCQNTVPGA